MAAPFLDRSRPSLLDESFMSGMFFHSPLRPAGRNEAASDVCVRRPVFDNIEAPTREMVDVHGLFVDLWERGLRWVR